MPISQDKFLNSGLLRHPHLAFFGDNYPSPSWLPLHNVYSIGDGLILCGVAWLIHRTCRSALARDPRPALRRGVDRLRSRHDAAPAPRGAAPGLVTRSGRGEHPAVADQT